MSQKRKPEQNGDNADLSGMLRIVATEIQRLVPGTEADVKAITETNAWITTQKKRLYALIAHSHEAARQRLLARLFSPLNNPTDNVTIQDVEQSFNITVKDRNVFIPVLFWIYEVPLSLSAVPARPQLEALLKAARDTRRSNHYGRHVEVLYDQFVRFTEACRSEYRSLHGESVNDPTTVKVLKELSDVPFDELFLIAAYTSLPESFVSKLEFPAVGKLPYATYKIQPLPEELTQLTPLSTLNRWADIMMERVACYAHVRVGLHDVAVRDRLLSREMDGRVMEFRTSLQNLRTSLMAGSKVFSDGQRLAFDPDTTKRARAIRVFAYELVTRAASELSSLGNSKLTFTEKQRRLEAFYKEQYPSIQPEFVNLSRTPLFKIREVATELNEDVERWLDANRYIVPLSNGKTLSVAAAYQFKQIIVRMAACVTTESAFLASIGNMRASGMFQCVSDAEHRVFDGHVAEFKKVYFSYMTEYVKSAHDLKAHANFAGLYPALYLIHVAIDGWKVVREMYTMLKAMSRYTDDVKGHSEYKSSAESISKLGSLMPVEADSAKGSAFMYATEIENATRRLLSDDKSSPLQRLLACVLTVKKVIDSSKQVEMAAADLQTKQDVFKIENGVLAYTLASSDAHRLDIRHEEKEIQVAFRDDIFTTLENVSGVQDLKLMVSECELLSLRAKRVALAETAHKDAEDGKSRVQLETYRYSQLFPASRWNIPDGDSDVGMWTGCLIPGLFNWKSNIKPSEPRVESIRRAFTDTPDLMYDSVMSASAAATKKAGSGGVESLKTLPTPPPPLSVKEIERHDRDRCSRLILYLQRSMVLPVQQIASESSSASTVTAAAAAPRKDVMNRIQSIYELRLIVNLLCAKLNDNWKFI